MVFDRYSQQKRSRDRDRVKSWEQIVILIKIQYLYLPHLAGSGVTVRCVRDRDRETKAEVNKAMASPMMRTFDLRKEEICEKAETAERDQQRKKGRKTIYKLSLWSELETQERE